MIKCIFLYFPVVAAVKLSNTLYSEIRVLVANNFHLDLSICVLIISNLETNSLILANGIRQILYHWLTVRHLPFLFLYQLLLVKCLKTLVLAKQMNEVLDIFSLNKLVIIICYFCSVDRSSSMSMEIFSYKTNTNVMKISRKTKTFRDKINRTNLEFS